MYYILYTYHIFVRDRFVILTGKKGSGCNRVVISRVKKEKSGQSCRRHRVPIICTTT